MNNNDLHKNQPNARNISDDSLENVSGGWQELESAYVPILFGDITSSNPRYKLNKKERKKLESLGYTISRSYTYNDGGYKVKKDGRHITYDEMRNIFGNEKF